jgi:uncharacterized membrane protein
MESKIKVAGHPLHPMLVGFPVTLYVVTFACFLAARMGADPFWFRVGVYANLGGIATAAVAAVPGFIDWAFGVESGTPAKSTGLAHMGFNVGALVVFALNLFLVWNHRVDAIPSTKFVLLPLIGLGLTVAAGFLGWKMVQTHHVGVDLTPEQRRLEPRPTQPLRPATPPHGMEHGPRPSL